MDYYRGHCLGHYSCSIRNSLSAYVPIEPLLEGVVLLFCFSHISRQSLYFSLTAIFVIILLLIPVMTFSATITVRSRNDEINEDGDCSLREAIASANQDQSVDDCEAGNGADIIEFAPRQEPRRFRLFRGGINDDTGASGDLDITDDLTIMGLGEEETIIQLEADRESVERIFDIVVPEGQTIFVTIANLTLTVSDSQRGQGDHGDGIRNQAGGVLRLEQVTIRDLQSDAVDGGTVLNEGGLTLDQCTIVNNHGGSSGGILNTGTLDVMQSRIAGNIGSMGGGILNRNRLTVDASTVSDNRAPGGSGGGIYNESIAIVRSSALAGNLSNRGGAIFNQGVMVIENTTLSGNESEGAGGIDNQNVLTIRHSTMTDNTGNMDTGGIRSDGVVELFHTIVAGNTADVPETDCSGTGIMSQGYNLVGMGCPNNGVSDRTISGDLVMTTVLGPLQDNGGPTVTHALQPDSVAIDAGGMDCPPPDVDQRGLPRPSDGNGDGLPICDIGAFEADPIPTADQLLLVSARANIGSAGLDRAVVTGCGESDPGHLPPHAPIPEGATAVRLMAMGEVILNDLTAPLMPDGEVVGEMTYTGPDGIGGLTTERRGFLAGIFAPDAPPSLPAPPPLIVTGQEQVQAMLTSPPLQLYNLFYIGDGQTLAGQTLVVEIPPEATRLYLGVVDACDGEPQLGSYNDNRGNWIAEIEFVFDAPASFGYTQRIQKD